MNEIISRTIMWEVEDSAGAYSTVTIDSDGDLNIKDNEDGHLVRITPTDLIALAEAVKNELNNTQEGE